jgi:hypothetical protein
MPRRFILPCALLCSLVLGTTAGESHAKKFGLSTPSRSIYKNTETFSEVLDQNRRKWVVEVALGNGPEGNIGIALGYLLNNPQGLEFYLGYGTRIGPSLHHSAAFRYFLPFLRYRGYMGAGYTLQRDTKIGFGSHNSFAEVGYKWILRHTFHMTLSAGVQRRLATYISDKSVLNDPDVNADFLRREIDESADYRFLFTLRFSRAL